jgi:hypothetical protein
MSTLTKQNSKMPTTGSSFPSSISEVTARDIAWIIAGMLLAYLVTAV